MSQAGEGQCRLRVLLSVCPSRTCRSSPAAHLQCGCIRQGGWLMPGPCVVIHTLAVCLAGSKASEGGECSGGPSDGQVLPGPRDLCSSLPGRACQSPSVLAYCLLFRSAVSDQGRSSRAMQQTNWQAIASTYFPQLSSGRRRHPCSFGNGLCLLARLVPCPQHTDPAWPNTLLSVC